MLERNQVNLKKNEFGYYEISPMPSDEDLKEFYTEEYFQKNVSKSYSNNYTEEELRYFDVKNEQKEIIAGDFDSFLDVGCGEGYVLSFFSRKGYSVVGLEYDSYSINKHNPSILDKCLIGDIEKKLKKLISKKAKFDIVNLDNVLEHTPHPKELLELCYRLCNKRIIIKVPNDFSPIQKYFVENKITKDNHWIYYPDHLNYFNKDGLENLCKAVGFKTRRILGNYLTEFFIFHPYTNYVENQDLGKSCHLARVKQEIFLHEISALAAIDLYETLGNMGVGREIIYVGERI